MVATASVRPASLYVTEQSFASRLPLISTASHFSACPTYLMEMPYCWSKEWHGIESFTAAEDAARRDLALTLARPPSAQCERARRNVDRANERCRPRQRFLAHSFRGYSSTTMPRSTLNPACSAERATAVLPLPRRENQHRALHRHSASVLRLSTPGDRFAQVEDHTLRFVQSTR